jgi:hypothetical protein
LSAPMAFLASASLANSTKPNPRDRLLMRSIMIVADATVP